MNILKWNILVSDAGKKITKTLRAQICKRKEKEREKEKNHKAA